MVNLNVRKVIVLTKMQVILKIISLYIGMILRCGPEKSMRVTQISFWPVMGGSIDLQKDLILNLKLCMGKNGSADEPAAQAFVKAFYQTLLENFKHLSYGKVLEIVMNFDEFGWIIKTLPKRSYLHSDTPVKAKKPMKARVTVLIGCSAAGLKFKPLVIGKSIRPLCFRSMNMADLPVHYYHQDSAWMSSELFTDYFNEEIVPTIKKNFPQQRVIVTMDNATCHPPTLNDIDDLIDVQFLPPNTTSLIQPCDQQVIFSLKSRVRNVYFTKLLTYVRTHPEADNPYQDFLKSYTLKAAVYDLAKCWDELPLSIIEQSYNNILKRKLLQDGLARDFEGFRDEQPRARAGFEDIVVGEQPTVDFDSQIQTNGRVLDNEVQ
ncbi:unnamed protein product [Meganyctiphanes norvegica]|uniref:DDE-1 domain-containing protein n=1 Tax=Meganyctiphanes norvegica TaxID=48144 RepID=A0AAV2SKH5_MEGNR